MSAAMVWTVHPEEGRSPAGDRPRSPLERALMGDLGGEGDLLRDLGSHGRFSSPGPTGPRGRPFGVIDLGSNTGRLVVYRSAPVGPPWSVFEAKDTPRLGSELLPDGRITEVGRRRGLETLVRFRRMLDLHGIRTVRAVATSAVRDAPNHVAFAGEVQRRCGFRLKVLSASDEARLGYLGVASSLPLDDDLVLDLGGGSMQLMMVRAGQLKRSLSLPLGALRLHRRFLAHDPPKRRELEALEAHLDRGLEVLDLLPRAEDERVIGVGGTTRCLAHVVQAIRSYPVPRVHGFEIRTRDLERLYEILSESSVAVRREVPGLSADRADIVVAGLAVVLAVLHRRDAHSLAVSGCGIREGIAQEVLERPVPRRAAEMARASALATLWAFGLDIAHARRVRDLALELFDLTRRQHRMDEEERLALDVAALLHDVGTAVAYAGHAAHSSFLLLHRPLYGLDHRGLLLSALAAGMHEGDDLPGGTGKRYASVLREDDVDVVRRLGSMLAMAESLADLRPRARLQRRGDRLVVGLPHRRPANPRLFDRSARWMLRSLELEVRTHGA